MHIANHLSLARLPPQTDDGTPRSHLLVDGQPSGVTLDGAVLEAAVQWGDHHLLFITDDVPYEEFLCIVLLGADLQTVDAAELGAAYSTGSFSGLALHPPDTVSFRFIGDTTWTVRLLHANQFRLPLVSEPRGVSRRLGFTRRFVVDGDPQPERG